MKVPLHTAVQSHAQLRVGLTGNSSSFSEKKIMQIACPLLSLLQDTDIRKPLHGTYEHQNNENLSTS